MYITLLPLSPGSKYRSRNWVYLFPRRSPPSRRKTWDHRSFRPFGEGVPVSSTIRPIWPPMLASALNLLDLWLLKLLLSSTTTMSNGQAFR